MFRIGLSLPLFFLFLAWILLSCPVSAQERTMVFEKYGIEEGIPESRIVSILQDDQGFIWFATQNGLVKYDGYDFHIYRPYPKEVDSTQLNLSNLSGGIIKGKDGRIWIGGVSNAGGVAYFDPQKERFHNFHYEAENPHSLIPYSKSLLLTEDRWGGIWFNNFSPQSRKKILCRLDPESRQLQQFPYALPKRHNEILLNKNGTFAKARADGSIWLIDDHQHLRRWMPGQDSFSIVHRAGRPLPGSSHKDSIRAVLASQEDEMFLVAAHRFHVWDPVAQKVVHTYSHDPQDPNSLAPGKLDYVFEDHEGSYWAVGVEGSLSRVNPQQQQVSRYAYGKGKLAFPKGPQQIGRLVIYASGPDGLWFRTYAKAKPHFLQYDFHTQSFFYYDHNFNFKAKQLLSAQGQKKAFSLFKDQSSLLWLGYHGGLYRQAPKKKLISYYTHLEEDPHSLPAESITSLFEDSKQRLWVGTEKGLARYLPHEDQFESLPFFPGAMEGYGVNRIIEDAAGRIWVATEGGLFLFDEPSQTCKQVVFPAFEGKGPIDIMEDPKRRLWVVVWQQGVHVLDQQRAKVLRSFYPREGDSTALPSHRLQSIYQDTKGRIWFGNRFENFPGLVRWDEAQQRFFHYIRRPEKKLDIFNPEIKYLFEDPQGTLWVGTDGSLCSYDETADRFETFQDPINIKSTSSHIKDADGIVWLGTYAGGGLIRFDTRNRTQRVFGESKGLLHNNSSSFNHHTSLAIDHFGKVYYPTMRGLSVFDPSTEEFTHYFKEDGFQPYGLKYISLVTHNGDVWIGSPNGLNRIQPAQLMAKDTTPPFVHITAVQIMDTTYSLPDGKYFPLAVPFSKQVSLKHDQNDVSFEFVALHYLRSTANQYAWKLENYDKDWSKPSLERKASYTNLDPGTYTFRVKASNADGTWNEEGASMTLIIAPPWWATWWARGGLIALLLGLGYLVYRFQLRRRLEQAEAHRLKELDAVKSRLYTNITHEFRTPLTVIRGMAQKIRSQPAEAEKMILRNSNNLLRLVNQMLDLSKLESGKLEVRLLHGNVIAYLRYLTESFQSYAASKNINLVFYTESEEVMMDYDEEKLQQIVSNLLSNAIKFSGESSKIVLHSSLALQAGGEHLIIKVKDQGVGIPPEQLPHIFDRFYQVDGSSTRKGEGTGIGLTFTRELVELLGGKIEVASRVQQGTTFTVSLPVSRQAALKSREQEALAPEMIPEVSDTPAAPQATLQGELPRVLVIEDNPDVTFYIRSCLEGPYQVLTAENGKIGIEKALEHTPDLIISDVMMPEKDGLEVCQTLKRDERSSHIPIILLTAKADVASRIAGLQEGADAYLAKPFEKEELLVRMEQLILLRKTLQDRYRGRELAPLPTVTQDKQYKREDGFIRKVQLLIEGQLSEPDFSIDKLARDLGMSRSQLFRKVKALTGKSVMIFVRSYRLQRARQLLLSTDLSISEIAYEVGFKTPSHFSASFLEEFGTQPSSLREGGRGD